MQSRKVSPSKQINKQTIHFYTLEGRKYQQHKTVCQVPLSQFPICFKVDIESTQLIPLLTMLANNKLNLKPHLCHLDGQEEPATDWPLAAVPADNEENPL